MDQMSNTINITNETATSTATATLAPTAPNVFSTNQVPFIAILIFACLSLLSFICSCRRDPEANERDAETESAQESAPDTLAQALAKKIKKMTTEERTTFYNKAFKNNKHQTVLKESAIIVGRKGDKDDANTKSTEQLSESNTGGGVEDDDDPSIYLALKEVRATRRSTLMGSSTKSAAVEVAPGNSDDNTFNQDIPQKQQRRRTSILHPRLSMSSAKFDLEHGHMDTRNNGIVRGNCVICFEDMLAGEEVVWSENRSCQHVYHKHCMVSYLAHKKQTLKELEIDENPCPTCRRKFLSVCSLAK